MLTCFFAGRRSATEALPGTWPHGGGLARKNCGLCINWKLSIRDRRRGNTRFLLSPPASPLTMECGATMAKDEGEGAPNRTVHPTLIGMKHLGGNQPVGSDHDMHTGPRILQQR